ncbi:MAG: hypothetical protein P8Y36_06460, partial [Alphaproteobacteria bacterium]
AADGHIALTTLQGAGFDITFDPGKVEMQINPTVEQRAVGHLSAGQGRESVTSANLTQPAILAGYLNMRGGADYATHSFYSGEGTTNARVGFDGALRWHGIVLESAATFDMEDDLSRGSTRFVYDMPENALRFSAGDVTPGKTLMQGGSDILGVSLEKSYQKLQPAASIHPTGSQSFRIERPSNVDVVINGHVSRRLHLRPGDYNMSDLPLSAGANDISLVIEDDLGHKRTLNFSVFSGRSLLAPGVAEWAFNAGFVSRINSEEKNHLNLYSGVEYDFDTPVVSGFYERGLTPSITGSIHLQADPDTVMGGSGASFQTPIGFWTVDGAVSQSQQFGGGLAGKVNYDLSNIQSSDGIRRNFRAAAEYRSETFSPIGGIDPQNNTLAILTAAYSQELPWDLFGAFTASYLLGRGPASDRYGVNASFSRSFGQTLSAGVSAGYQQTLSGDDRDTVNDGFKAALRLTYRIDDASSMDAAYDARYGQSQVSYRRQEGKGIGAWGVQADISSIPETDNNKYGGNVSKNGNDDYAVNGSLTYMAERANLAVSQRTALAGLNTDETVQRTSVTAAAALAFADGRFALGHPISNGFAIIDTHKNLPDSDISVGSQDTTRAVSGLFGPALISNLSPYGQTSITYDISNLPIGYDLGTGAFDLYPGYKSGYRLTVGSDYTVAAMGVLTDHKGQPIKLLTGTAYEEKKPDGRKVTVFTNRDGKFNAQGLCPGRWILDMATSPTTRFVLDVPEDAVGNVKLGTLKPTGGSQ